MEVETWGMSELSGQQTMMLHMMEAMTMLGKELNRSRHGHCVEGRVVEKVGEVSGRHSASGTNAPALEGNGTAVLWVHLRWLWGIQACRREAARSAAMVSTGWSVRHLIGLHCLR